MEILKKREEKGYGVELYYICENEEHKIKAKKIPSGGKRVLSAPLDVHIAVTNKCNMTCSYCYANDKKFSKQIDMTFTEIINIIDQCYNSNVFKLSWSGGEPLCRPEIFEILEYASRKNFRQSIITNGTLITDEKARILEKLQISVQISLHEVHDITFWEKCKLLIENNINVILDVVIDESIQENINSIINYCRKIGIKNVKFGPIIPIGLAKESIILEDYKITINKVLKEIDKHRNQNDIRIVTQFDNHKYKKESQILDLRDLLCEGATTLIYIDNNGDVYPCPLLKGYEQFFAGNILKNGIIDIWNGKVMNEYRRINTKETGCYGCDQICGVWCRGLTIAYTGEISGHSPFCENTIERG